MSNIEEKWLWGIHTYDDNLFLKEGVIAIGWKAIGDLSLLPPDRESMKEIYAKAYPDDPKGSIPKLMDNRYKKMQAAGEKTCSKADIYLLIDELASISSNQKTSILAKLQKISQNGRPVKIHVIVTTQCPTTNVIPTAIKVNFDAILGLRTRSAQDSRNIIGENGCEKLPQHGKGYYIKPDGRFVIDIHEPYDEDINAIIEYWSNPVNYIKS